MFRVKSELAPVRMLTGAFLIHAIFFGAQFRRLIPPALSRMHWQVTGLPARAETER